MSEADDVGPHGDTGGSFFWCTRCVGALEAERDQLRARVAELEAEDRITGPGLAMLRAADGLAPRNGGHASQSEGEALGDRQSISPHDLALECEIEASGRYDASADTLGDSLIRGLRRLATRRTRNAQARRSRRRLRGRAKP